MADQYDIAIIGGGPGGYVAAIRAAQLGMKTVVIEREHLGGICLNWGCIPTKALLRSAEVYHYMENAEAFGLKAEKFSYDIKKVVERSRGVSKQLSGGVGHLMKKNKITVIDGEARITKPGEIKVSGKNATDVKASHIVVATGARPRVLPGIEPDKKLIWTYFEAMVPEEMPKSLLIIGSGAIGIEFASFYRTMGAEVTVVEVMDKVLPVEDAEISAHALKRFKKQGMNVLTSSKVTAVQKNGDYCVVSVEDGEGKMQEFKVDRVISAVGVQGNVENVGLEDVGVKVERGAVITDDYGRTNVPGIYAIGDVAGPPLLAHKAEHEGVICVEAIKGLNDVHPMKRELIPGCTYCNPQVASVGLTEAKAKEAGYELRIGRFPFVGNGKAIALGEPEGMVKTIFDKKTGQLLGAHMIGAEVTELIQGYIVAMNLETTEEELMHTVFPHPTLSEMMHESVLDAYDRVVHM